jgi:ribosome-binding ATPase YchF (GTP1/OBG family)
MTPPDQNIKTLQQKVQLLIKSYQQLKKENNHLKKELNQLKEKQAAVKQEFEIVELQNAMLKAGQHQLEEKEKKELERKFLQFIHEIDRCIAVLSR